MAWLMWLKVPEGKVAAAPLDLLGTVLLTASLLGLVWGLVHGNRVGWGSAEVLASLGAGGVLGAAFVASQCSRAWDAMIPPRLFRSPVLAVGLTISLLLTASLFGTLFFMAQFFQVTRGLSPLAAGASMLPWTATLFLVAPVAGAMVTRVGERTLVVAGLALQAAGMVWLTALVRGDAAYLLWVIPLMIAGAGISMAMPAVCRAPCWPRWSRRHRQGRRALQHTAATGRRVGCGAGGGCVYAGGGYGSPQQFSAGFAATLGVCAALSLAGAAVGLRLKSRARRGSTVVNVEGVQP